MKKIEAIKDIRLAPTRLTFPNPKKTWYVDASYNEFDGYLYWQQSIFAHIDNSQRNHASSNNHSAEEFGEGIIPFIQCVTNVKALLL